MAQITQAEAKQKTQEKVKAIETLCKQLEVTLSAEQVVTPQGIIKQIVYYVDNEQYDIAGEENTKQDEKTTTEPAPEAEDKTPEGDKEPA